MSKAPRVTAHDNVRAYVWKCQERALQPFTILNFCYLTSARVCCVKAWGILHLETACISIFSEKVVRCMLVLSGVSQTRRHEGNMEVSLTGETNYPVCGTSNRRHALLLHVGIRCAQHGSKSPVRGQCFMQSKVNTTDSYIYKKKKRCTSNCCHSSRENGFIKCYACLNVNTFLMLNQQLTLLINVIISIPTLLNWRWEKFIFVLLEPERVLKNMYSARLNALSAAMFSKQDKRTEEDKWEHQRVDE